jgi:hypothetical protein
MKSVEAVTEADILNDIIVPGRRDFSPEAARSIVSLHFSRSATTRIRSLLRANNRGSISAQQRVELEKYLRVGQLLDLLQAKARLALHSRKAA